MSRSRILPSFSSSRQMMMAWKVSGLSHSPAIMASRPASMRLAMAISPSRDRSSTEPISRRYMRTGSSVRSVGSLVGVSALAIGAAAITARGRIGGPLLARGRRLLGLVGVDDVDAHVGEHRHGVLDLLGGYLLGGEHLVQLVIGDKAARLRGLDQLLDRSVGHVEHGAVGGLRLGLLLILGFSGFGCHSCYSEAQIAIVSDALRPWARRARYSKRSTFSAYFTQAINGCSVNRQLSMTPCPRLARRLSILAPSVGRLSLSPKQHGPSGQDRGRTTCRYFREVCSNSTINWSQRYASRGSVSVAKPGSECAKPAPKNQGLRGGCTSKHELARGFPPVKAAKPAGQYFLASDLAHYSQTDARIRPPA